MNIEGKSPESQNNLTHRVKKWIEENGLNSIIELRGESSTPTQDRLGKQIADVVNSYDS